LRALDTLWAFRATLALGADGAGRTAICDHGIPHEAAGVQVDHAARRIVRDTKYEAAVRLADGGEFVVERNGVAVQRRAAGHHQIAVPDLRFTDQDFLGLGAHGDARWPVCVARFAAVMRPKVVVLERTSICGSSFIRK
jgi:hypothetical protein